MGGDRCDIRHERIERKKREREMEDGKLKIGDWRIRLKNWRLGVMPGRSEMVDCK